MGLKAGSSDPEGGCSFTTIDYRLRNKKKLSSLKERDAEV